ncbi:MAG: phenylacetate-CoA oxygenase subunit PaaC [Parvularculaceae bacterium]|jgi:ring-1,2-phenylacetyl-CoA epoxidase subunit PaaC|nr:phenylacetate-CoA oxygenase subunit PaaC [Parvularculaceae bacterium]
MDRDLFEFALRMGDNALILGQQVSAWCGHAPALEEDIALANTALDLIGQAKLWLDLAGEIEGAGRDADALAFLRDARAFRNALLVEQSNGDYGQTLMRQFLFDAWHFPTLKSLAASGEPRIAAIAVKAAKEAEYHFERSRDLVIGLGDGSEESHVRMQRALDLLYPFQGELTAPDSVDEALRARDVAPDLAAVKLETDRLTLETLAEATLRPPPAPVRKGGKTGLHSEGLGRILSDMQFLQRAYPGASW